MERKIIWAVVLASVLAFLPIAGRAPVVADEPKPEELTFDVDQVLVRDGSLLILFRALDREGKFVSGLRPNDLKVTISGCEISGFSLTLFSEMYLVSWPVSVGIISADKTTATFPSPSGTSSPSPTARVTATPTTTVTPVRGAPVTEAGNPLLAAKCLLIASLAFAAGYLLARNRYAPRIGQPTPPEEVPEEEPVEGEVVVTELVILEPGKVLAGLKAVRDVLAEKKPRRVTKRDILTRLIIEDPETASRVYKLLQQDGWIAGNGFPSRTKAEELPAAIRRLESELGLT